MELLKEIYPKVNRPIAVLWNPAYVGMRARYEQAEAAASIVGVTIRSVEARNSGELERAFNAIAKERFDALVLLADPLTMGQRARIVAFAAEKRLPAIYEAAEFVEAGGLVSYGPSYPALDRRAATYVDKILKGANPGDIPIEQPTKFELVVNMKTAKTLGITFPPAFLLQADRVIE